MATKAGKGSRKKGRNLKSCQAYRLARRREHNKIARLKKHLGRFPGDACAEAAVEKAKKDIRTPLSRPEALAA